jgi:glucose/arabinose dehydrogenase
LRSTARCRDYLLKNGELLLIFPSGTRSDQSIAFKRGIVVVKLNEDGSFKSLEPFLTGFIQNNNYVRRPADVLVMKDGSLLVSDDYNGAVYRISYD